MPPTPASQRKAYARKVAKAPTGADLDPDGLPKFDILRRQKKAWFADRPAERVKLARMILANLDKETGNI